MIYLGEQNFDVDYVYSCLVFFIREGYVKPETLAIPSKKFTKREGYDSAKRGAIPSLQAMTHHKERI